MQMPRNSCGRGFGGWPKIVRLMPVFLLTIVLFPSAGATGQVPAHSYVPLEHWSMPYIEHLISKKVIPDPLPMVRPFTVRDLQRVLGAVDSVEADLADLELIGRLQSQFSRKEDWVGVTIETDAGVWAGTHARRNSNLRESGDGHVFPRLGVNGVLQTGFAAVVMHPEWDPNIKYDPDYAGKDPPIKVYYPNAYLAFRSKYVQVDLGRMRRNWGPVGVNSLLVSPVPYPYDHFFFLVGTERVFGHFLVADIDPMINSNGELSNRYLAAHRITARPWDFISLAVWGGQIIAAPGRHWELWFVNPVPVQAQSRDEQNRTSNVTVGGDGELRLGDFRISGSLSLDDLQLISTPAKNEEPPAYALTGVVNWTAGKGVYTLEYSLISNLSYRTHDPAESFLIDRNQERGRSGVGLAHNFSDYDLLTLRAGFLLRPGILVEPELSVLRQGEGDLRLPFPPEETYPDLPSVHTGTVETTLRAAIQGNLAHASGVQLSFDAGVHRILDFQHVEGASETRFVGTFHVRYKIGAAISLE